MTAHRNEWKAPALAVVVATTAMGGFGGGAVGQPLLLAAIGLGWGLALVGAAMILSRNERRRPLLATGSLLLASLAAGILFGFGILDLALSKATLAQAPETYYTFWQPPFEGVFVIGLIIQNSTLEWLVVPAVLLLNWHLPKRRRLLLIAAAVYYAMRIWSYLYFVPQALSWSDTPPGEPFSADKLALAQDWVNLSFLRGAADGLVFVLFLLALATPAVSRRAVATGGDEDPQRDGVKGSRLSEAAR